MRHVDEGTIHAWLDRQVIDPQEVAWITTHLRECAACTARVAEEEATLRDAESLLASVAPAADGSRAAFEALVATAKQKTAGQQSGAGAPDASNRVLPFGRWMAPASLAAMIALAIGLGWMARQMTSPRGTVTPASAPPMAQHRAEPAAVPPDAVPPDTAPPLVNPERRQQETTALEPGRKVVEPQKPSSGTLATPAEESARVASASQTRATRAEAADGGGQAVTPLVPAAPPPTPPPLAIVPSPPASPAQAAGGTPAVAQTPTGDPPRFRTGGADSVSASEAVAAPPPPVAVAGGVPDAGAGRGGRAGGGGGGGGRGGGRGRAGGVGEGFGIGAGVSAGTGNGIGPAAAASAPTDSVNQGRIMVDGLQISPAPITERVDGIEWTLLARSTAAERSGMALYGIAGLTPARTMVNADASKVRTVYLVDGAEVELLQEKQSPTPSGAAATSDPAAVSFARSAGSQAESQNQQRSSSLWSSVRGDVVLTLRAGADAAALGARVRLD